MLKKFDFGIFSKHT